MTVVIRTLVAFVSCAALLLAAPAGAPAFPDKPVQFLVGFSPGGPTDLSARAIAKVAPKHLGGQMVVVNLPGAASTVALAELARREPDGHTIALMMTSYRALVVHQQKLVFDPKVLKPLLGYAEFRQLLFVKGDFPHAKAGEFLAWGRKNPGAIKFAHSGRGTSIHLQGLLFFREARIDAPDVPYRGSGEYVQAVLGGHVTAGVIDIGGVKAHFPTGALRPVVAFVDERFKELPEVPTAKEIGIGGLSVFNPLVAAVVHRDTPADRLKKLHDALRKTAEDPEFLKALDTMGLKGGYMPPEVVEDTIARAEARAVPVLRDLKLLVE